MRFPNRGRAARTVRDGPSHQLAGSTKTTSGARFVVGDGASRGDAGATDDAGSGSVRVTSTWTVA